MEKRYMISDAAKMVDVEAHVLRYWEDELEIEIPRNEMGHRYYTDELIALFKSVKELKEQGFLLKAIKMILPELSSKGISQENPKSEAASVPQNTYPSSETAPAGLVSNDVSPDVIKANKMEQFQLILGNIVSKALEENNDALGDCVSVKVSDSVCRQLDTIMKLKEEHEEERFKKLDETIRNYQSAKKEAAKDNRKILKFFKKKPTVS